MLIHDVTCGLHAGFLSPQLAWAYQSCCIVPWLKSPQGSSLCRGWLFLVLQPGITPSGVGGTDGIPEVEPSWLHASPRPSPQYYYHWPRQGSYVRPCDCQPRASVLQCPPSPSPHLPLSLNPFYCLENKTLSDVPLFSPPFPHGS